MAENEVKEKYLQNTAIAMRENANGQYEIVTTPGIASGGSQASTTADGADVTQGAKADTPATSTGSFSVVALLKALLVRMFLSDNAAAPVANTLSSVMPAVANAAETAAVEGRLVTLSLDLSRRLRAVIQGNVAAAVADAGNPVKIGGKYNLTRPTYTDGQRGDAQLTSSGGLITSPDKLYGEDPTNDLLAIHLKPIAASGYQPSSYKDFGTVTKANIKNTPGNVYALRITNINAAVRYFQLHNKASAPVATEVPQLSFMIPAGTATAPAILEIDMSWFALYENFSLGIGWAISTTRGTFTDSATASEHGVDVRYM